jgi:hypothetical protein
MHVLMRAPGGAGGPQQHPWELGAAFTESFVAYSQALLPPDDAEDDTAVVGGTTAAATAAAGDGASRSSCIPGLPDSSTCGLELPALQVAPHPSTGGGSGGEAGLQKPSPPSLLPPPLPLQPRRRAADGVRLRRRFIPYPQNVTLGAALLEAQLWLLGRLLAVMGPTSQMQTLQVRALQV